MSSDNFSRSMREMEAAHAKMIKSLVRLSDALQSYNETIQGTVIRSYEANKKTIDKVIKSRKST